MAGENDVMDDDEGGGAKADWMATFADMMTLLLTFFVLLLSFATMDITQFRMALGSVKDALGVRSDHPGDREAVASTVVQLSTQESTDQLLIIENNELMRQIKETVAEKDLEDVVEVSEDGRGVIVRIRGQVLYDTGSDQLLPGAAATLDAVAEIANMVPHPVSVEGHTDDRPIHTTRFPSNWELSTARAAAGMRYLVDERGIDASRLGIAGYADMRPIDSNDSEEGRARNRRVEFVFIRPTRKEAKEAAQKAKDAAKAAATKAVGGGDPANAPDLPASAEATATTDAGSGATPEKTAPAVTDEAEVLEKTAAPARDPGDAAPEGREKADNVVPDTGQPSTSPATTAPESKPEQ